VACRRWHGISAGEIRAAIMQARDLAKKGSPQRQREYAERTPPARRSGQAE